MKLGAENRNKTIVAVALAVVALGLALNWFFTLPSAQNGANAPATVADAPSAAASHAKPTKKTKAAPSHSIDPTLRYDWLKTSEDTKYAGNGRNIFQDQAEIPVPISDGRKEIAKGPVAPPPPPPPPPINLKFFGFSNKPGEGKKVFLSQGEDVFIAHEGDIVDRRYKVVHIMPTSVEIEDVLNNNRQSIPLTQG